MERKKYLKHKPGFKIAVEHKLNCRLKADSFPYDLDEEYDSNHPLYVEIRAKKQRTYVKSIYPFFIEPDLFKMFTQDSCVQALLQIEVKLISDHLRNYIDTKGEDFKIGQWHDEFKESFWRRRLLSRKAYEFTKARFTEFVESRGNSGNEILHLIQFNFEPSRVYSFIKILKGFGINILEDFQTTIEAYFRVSGHFNKNLHSWCGVKFSIAGTISDFLSYDIVASDYFSERIKSHDIEEGTCLSKDTSLIFKDLNLDLKKV